ncbi:MAG: exodeoxyribonuclease III [Pseudomonadota bacterium]
MQVATWNINGIKARLETCLAWLDEAQPDVACFQEIKSEDAPFPREAFEQRGYHLETHGQKGFNGVALLSKRPFESVEPTLPGDADDPQARFISARVAAAGPSEKPINVSCLYLPNGNPLGTEKYPYKLAWMERLLSFARNAVQREEPLILAGDYNVIPDNRDLYSERAWLDDALYQPESRALLRQLEALGFTDAVRAVSDEQHFTFWDYQGGAWQKNHGIRIDHLMLAPAIADRLLSVRIDDHVRGWEKPSDHVPVVASLSD